MVLWKSVSIIYFLWLFFGSVLFCGGGGVILVYSLLLYIFFVVIFFANGKVDRTRKRIV